MKTGKLVLALMVCVAFLFPQSGLAEEEKDDALQLETVVVTSQKVENDKQDVPANITVFDSGQLDDLEISQMDELALATPNVNFVKMDAHTTQLIFRGIGGMANMNKLWNINVDGVAVPYVAVETLLDVERVEVLRGSQGALYGRNTHAGAVNIITKSPSKEPSAEFSAEYGSFNTFNASTAFGGVVSEDSAYRIALGLKRSDGYHENTFLDKKDTNWDEQFTARAKFEYAPENVGKLTFGLHIDKYNSGFDSYGPMGKPVSTKVENNEPGYNNGYLLSPTLTWEKDFGGLNLTSITNYSRSNYTFLHDWDFSRNDIQDAHYDEDINSFTQELRLNGGEGTDLRWLVGAFGLVENLDTKTDIFFRSDAGMWMMNPGDNMKQRSKVDTMGAALFGQAIYRLIPSIEITGAVRVDYEHKELDWKNSTNLGLPTGTVKRSDSWLEASPSGSVAYLFNEDQRVYVSVARGFKSGDYNNVMTEYPLVQEPVDPEYTMTYETGYKGRHFDNQLELNAALFYIDWKDMQVDINTGAGVFTPWEKKNAAKAHTTGIELETKALLAKGWDIFGGFAYMFEYEFDDFQVDNSTNYKGNKIPYTNEYTVNLGSTYRHESGFFLGCDLSYRGEQYMNEANTARQGGYAIVNAKVGYEEEKWDVYLIGKNLLDKNYAVASFNNTYLAGEPLNIGIKGNIRF